MASASASALARLQLLCLSHSLRRKTSLPAIYSWLTPQFSFSSSSSSSFSPPPKLRKTRINAMAKRGFSPPKDDHVASPADLRFEVPLNIVKYPDPRLRAKNKRISTFDDNLNQLVHEMFDVMYKTDGIGLSAPQVGINVQLMVFNPAGERGQGEEIILVNPRVIKSSKRRVPFNEEIYLRARKGEFLKHRVLFSHCCRRSDYSGYVYPYGYSFLAKLHMKSLDWSPGHISEVLNRERPESVKVDAQDIAGKRFMVDLSGLPARVFQHEFDHLQGIVFFDRMAEDVLDSIRADLQALENKYEVSTGLPSPERVEARRMKVAVGFGRDPSAEA